jgi:hypothetical protein
VILGGGASGYSIGGMSALELTLMYLLAAVLGVVGCRFL